MHNRPQIDLSLYFPQRATWTHVCPISCHGLLTYRLIQSHTHSHGNDNVESQWCCEVRVNLVGTGMQGYVT